MPAAATLRMHPTRREAHLVDLDAGAARAGDLCDDHAGELQLPRGWWLRDDRAPRGDAGVDDHDDDQPRPTSHTPEPEPRAEPLPEAPTHGVEPESVDALLDAQTPLLRRAFRSARPE